MTEESMFHRVIGGKSFCLRDEEQDFYSSYYVKGGGHGTAMADLICRVCPKAKLHILRLEDHLAGKGRQITARSAAKVSVMC